MPTKNIYLNFFVDVLTKYNYLLKQISSSSSQNHRVGNVDGIS